MESNLSTVGETAISHRVTSDVESSAAGQCPAVQSSNGKSDAANLDWFAEMAQGLLPTKPGTQLHYITGYDERLCQKYAAGSVKPSAYFLRVLLRSRSGRTFLAALMHGCEAEWWADLQKHERMGRAANNAR